MRVSNFGLSTLAALAVCAAPAFSHDITPYLCDGSSGDGVSSYVNISGSRCNQLQTAANGHGLPGFTMTDIDSSNQVGTNFLYFNFYGKANTTNGPFIFLTAHNSSGTVSAVIPASAGKVARSITGGVTYEYSGSNFGITGKGYTIDEIVFQLYPTSKADTVRIGSVHVNGLYFSLLNSAGATCPEGTSTTPPH